MKPLIAKTLQKIFVMPGSKRSSTILSANERYNERYNEVCLRASNDDRLFSKFRRDPTYNIILEHVSEKQGQEYLDVISKDTEVLSVIDRFKPNDDYGNPRMYKYPAIGKISPTTLRYIKVVVDLKRNFERLDNFNLCEIGVGYGGQCRIINAYFKPATYCLVDLQPALVLAQRYLGNYELHSVPTYKTMTELAQEDYDLVISNYAFTELPRTIQDVYISKVILRSRRGYITYNEITPVEFNSYKADELVEMIPGSTIIKEEPLTHPKNRIIVWGVNA